MDPLDEAKQGLMRAHTADRAKTGAQDPMDYVALGYLTPDGQATPFGDEFVAMVQGGLLEKDGTPTKEGEAYRMTHSESLEAPLEIYRLREERGLNQAEKDAAPDDGGFMGMLGKFATVGVPRLAETFWNSYAAPGIEYAAVIPRKIIEKVTGDTPTLPRTKQTFDEKVNAISENITGGILASEGLASGAKYHAELAAADPGAYMQAVGDFLPGVSDLIRAVHGDEAVTENIRMKADEAFAAKQRWERHNAEVAELKGAEMMNWLTDSDQWMQSRAALVAQHGEAAVKKNEEVDRLTGTFVLDPNNIASVGVGKMISGAVGSASRIALGAEKLALRSKVLQMGHAAAVAERTTLEAGATRAAAISKGAADRAAAFRAVGNEAQAVRYDNLVTKLEEKAGGLVSRVDELAATEAKLTGEIEKIGAKAGVADAIVRTTERARAIRQMPAAAFGEVSERIGTGLVKMDDFLADAAERVGITGVYKSMHSLPMRVGTMASSAVLGPVASAAAIGSQIMASGPFLQSIGNFSKVLGKELVMERGSVPFWRRVANNSTITKTQRFLAHRMDEATLGGMATYVARPVITGTAHAYPMNLAFEVLQNPEQDFGSASEHAFGPSLVFGGGTAGAGAIFKGSKQRLKEVRIADELNFTRNLDDGNKAGYNGISRGARRVVSTYAAAFPNLNWDFGHAGSSHYDATTNTARINPAGGNPLRALIGHEVMHYVTIRNQMEPVIHSMLLGDAETPGLLRHVEAPDTTEPTLSRARMRRLDTPERARAHELLNSGEFKALSALFHSTDKIAPRNPNIHLIKIRRKNGARLTNAEIRILELDKSYDGMAQALAHAGTKAGKIAKEALSMLMAPHGQGQAPSSMARYLGADVTPSELWQRVTAELKQLEFKRDPEKDKRNDNREWTASEIKSHLANKPKANTTGEKAAEVKRMAQEADFADANNPEHGNAPFYAEELFKGQEVTIAGVRVKVKEVVKARDSMGNDEVDHVILDGGERFGEQLLEGGHVIFADRDVTDSSGNHYLPDPTDAKGLLRAADGTLDPDFQRFRDEYDARMDAAGLERVSLPKIAEEYFNEVTVDHLLEMTDSGELSRMAGRTQSGRHIRAFIAATIPRSTILKDFFFRSGGVMEAGGRRVMGNGLLADGLRELPEAKAMMRNMVRKSAGEAVFQQPGAKGDRNDRTGVPLTVQKGDPIIDSFHAILQTDANGVPIKDAQGNHVALSRATDEARSSAGHIVTEAQTQRVQGGYLPQEGEMRANGDGTWSGAYIDRPLIDALAAKGILNAKQIAIMRNISTATKGGQGIRYLLTNHPATMKGRGGKVNYATLGATLRETVPVGFGITKDGNILVHLMSVHQLDANIQKRAASKRGRSLYNGNTEIIKQDVAAMMDLHRENTKTDKFYQDKYGAKWQEHQQFINTVFGLMTKAQAEVNPMFRQDNINSPKEHVYRTYRLDRISKATKMDGTPMPFGYEKVKVNFLPDGVVDPKDGGGKTSGMDGPIDPTWGVPIYAPTPNDKFTVRLHHGTWRGGYDQFHEGTHFTRSKTYAERYMSPSASSMGISGSKEATNQMVYSADVTFKRIFDTRKTQDRTLFEKEFYRQQGTGTPLQERGLPDWTDGVDLAEWLEENHPQYDGVVLDEGGEPVGDSIRVRPESYIPLKGAKIKIIKP